jgi:Zn-dependent M28 family amino/carboxypeptidase
MFSSTSKFSVRSCLRQIPSVMKLLTKEYSVSTGFGATDDGIGCVTVLQLIRFFTTPGNEPKKGIVALLNNGEEDYLNGKSTKSPFCKT